MDDAHLVFSANKSDDFFANELHDGRLQLE
jgi:hypothetical protein